MTRKGRKEAQRAAAAAAERRTKEALHNPDLPAEELQRFRATCAAYFSSFKPHARPSAVPARRTDGSDTVSRAGGSCLWSDDQEWPSARDGRPLACVFQLAVSELPVKPSALSAESVLQVFLDLEEDESELPSYSGGEWHVCSHEARAELVPRQNGSSLESRPISWQLVPETYPSYPDDLDIVPDELEAAFDRLPQSSALEVDTLTRILGTHVGGWPCWLTGGDVGDFILQLDSETLGVELGFDGQLYVGRGVADWKLVWEVG